MGDQFLLLYCRDSGFVQLLDSRTNSFVNPTKFRVLDELVVSGQDFWVKKGQ